VGYRNHFKGSRRKAKYADIPSGIGAISFTIADSTLAFSSKKVPWPGMVHDPMTLIDSASIPTNNVLSTTPIITTPIINFGILIRVKKTV
jgi:hypothetical protein